MNENPKGSSAQPNAPGADRSSQGVQGEGDYQATHRYQKEVGDFLKRADIEELAREAKPRSPEEVREMSAAEERGRERSKGDDPADAEEMARDGSPRSPGKDQGASKR